MIFCDADITHVPHICCILSCFKIIFCLKINLANSELFQAGDECDIDSLAWILGCKFGNLPATYLGLPIGCKL